MRVEAHMVTSSELIPGSGIVGLAARSSAANAESPWEDVLVA